MRTENAYAFIVFEGEVAGLAKETLFQCLPQRLKLDAVSQV